MTTTISSQRYLDTETVAAKSAAADYVVWFVTVELGGEDYRVVVDGHHSLAAARADGVEPDWTRQEQVQQEADSMGAEGWLEAHQHDSDWYDIATGHNVW